MPNLRNGSKGAFEPGLTRLRVRHSTTELPRSLTLGANKSVIFNVYMPYQCNDDEPLYLEKLGILKAIIDELDNTCYAIVGDWNANLKYIDNSLFANHVLHFCSENNF